MIQLKYPTAIFFSPLLPSHFCFPPSFQTYPHFFCVSISPPRLCHRTFLYHLFVSFACPLSEFLIYVKHGLKREVAQGIAHVYICS